MSLELDKILILAALALLVSLGWLTGAPIFEPFGGGRLTYLTVLAVPVLVFAMLLRRATPQIRGFLRSWWPVVAILAVYESLKHMHANRITQWLGIEPKDELMLRLDEILFGKALPLWMDSWTAPWFQGLMSFCYIWVYYALPVILLGIAYLFYDESVFRRLRTGLVLVLLGGYVLYLLVPVAGPKFLIGDQFRYQIPSDTRLETLVFDTLRFNWDCFPSLHTAVPWMLTVLAWRRLPGWVVAISSVLATGVTISTVALRFHYGIDLIAAFAWVGVVWVGVERLRRYDYGRRHLDLPNRRRRAARVSSLRGDVRRLAWAVAILAAASSVSLVAMERWSRLWIPSIWGPAGTGAALLAGLALGLWLAPRLPRTAAGVPIVCVAGLGVALWLGLAGLRSSATLVHGLAGALGPAIGPLGMAPAFVLLGVVLGGAVAVLGDRRLHDPVGAVHRWALPGALAGLLLARQVVHPAFGYGDSVLLAALAGVVGAWLCRKPQSLLSGGQRGDGTPVRAVGGEAVVALLGGAVGGALVVLWIYLLPATAGDELSGFGTVLLVGLAGATVAELVSLRRLPPLPRRLAATGWALLALALALGLLHPLWGQTPLALVRLSESVESYLGEVRLRGRYAWALMLLPSLIVGGVFRGLRSRGHPIVGGRILRCILLGGTAGCLAAAWIGIPLLGSEATMRVAIGAAAATGAVLVFRQSGGTQGLQAVGALILTLLLTGLFPWNALAFARHEHRDLGRGGWTLGRLLWSTEDPVAGFVAAFDKGHGPDSPGVLLANGLLHARSPAPVGERAVRLAAARAGEIERAAVLGLASTESLRALASLEVDEILLVEPSAAVVEGMRQVGGQGALAGVELVLASPREWLVTAESVDLVVIEVADFWLGVARGLFSLELYELVRESMDRDGILVQTIDLSTLSPREVETVLATLAGVLPDTSVWIEDGHALLLASRDAQPGPGSRGVAGPAPLLTPAQVGAFVLQRAPAIQSDRSGHFELRTPNLRLGGDFTAVNVEALERLATAPGAASVRP